MRSDDVSTLLASPRDRANLGARMGKVLEWNTSERRYVVEVGGVAFDDLPMMAIATLTAVTPGDTVAVLKYRDSYIIMGRVIPPGDFTPEPNLSIPMQQDFYSGGTPNTDGLQQIGGGTDTSWFGYAYVTHPRLWITAAFGPISGSPGPTCDIAIDVGAQPVMAQFRISTLTVDTFGPFDLRPYIGTSANQRIRVRKLPAVSGSGQFAFHIYGAYQRSY